MTGRIYFKTLAELAEFLSEFSHTGSTEEFEVEWVNNANGWELRFTGAN